MQFKGDSFYKRVSRQSTCYGRQFTRESKCSLRDSFYKHVSHQSTCQGRQFTQENRCSLRETVFTSVSVVRVRVRGGNLHERVNAV